MKREGRPSTSQVHDSRTTKKEKPPSKPKPAANRSWILCVCACQKGGAIQRMGVVFRLLSAAPPPRTSPRW